MQDETTKDELLKDIFGRVRTSWPHKCDLVGKRLAFYKVRENVSEDDGMLLRGEHMVVPEQAGKQDFASGA